LLYVSSRAASYSDLGRYVGMSPVENRVVDLILTSNKLAVCVFHCPCCI